MVTGHEHFSLSGEYFKKVSEILKGKSKKRYKSDWICQAIIEKFEAETKKKIDDYVMKDPETELDTAPRIYEPLTEEYLKQLSPRDVGRLHKMVYWNKKILDDYVASLERIEAMRRKYDR